MMARITAVRERFASGPGEVRLYVEHGGGWGSTYLDLAGQSYSTGQAREFEVLGRAVVAEDEMPYWEDSGVLDGPAVVTLAQDRIAALASV